MAEQSVDIEKPIIHRICHMSRGGLPMCIYTLLTSRSDNEIDSLINEMFMDNDGQKYTPFIIAASCGHYKVVKMLLDKFKPDLELEGTVKIEGSVIEGATALWCAAGAGHLNIVKTLVKAGADVNHATKTKSTPLRAACFGGRLDIVTYLVEHGADISIANKYNNTCLMIAAYKGHSDMVNYLLDHGADLHTKARCGATALHFAAENGHSTVIHDLLKRGAKMTKNIFGMTPAMTAAERTRVEAVEAFVDAHVLTKEENIDAFELLGASFANDKDNYSIPLAHDCLRRAMMLRYNDPNNIIYKKLGEPVKAYEYWKESETMEELEAIKTNYNAMHMECLSITERILGIHNPEVPQPVIYRGAVFADNGRFDRCIDLWLHALKLRQPTNKCCVKDLLRFAQIFSQMIHVGIELQFSQVLEVLKATVIELGRIKAKLENQDPEDDIDQCIEESESHVTCTLYIVTILSKLMFLNERNYDSKDVKKALHYVHQLCKLKMTLSNGQTLLHLAVNVKTPVDDFHTNDVCKFPCAVTTKLLVQCGADVNAMDNDRNTPLHLIVAYQKPVSDFMTLHCIILELIEAGAHMDTVNRLGKTPYDVATTGMAEIILRAQSNISLKCMAAKAVKTYGLSYSGEVPRALENFIELHGPGLKQG